LWRYEVGDMATIMTRQRILFRWAFPISAVVILAVLFAPIRIVRRSLFVCEATGSIKYRETSLGLVGREHHEASPLEDFIHGHFPDAIQHKWVWLGATEYNLLGSAVQHDDTCRQTYLLAEFVRSSVFAGLSSGDKKRIYDLLVWCCRTMSDVDKGRMYSELLNCGGENDVHGVLRTYEALRNTPAYEER
jgi:hypothetical protein